MNKRQIAQKLAQAHFSVEEGLIRVFRLVCKQEKAGEPIKLLEVNQDTIPTGIMPLHFDAAPARGIPYPSVIVEVTPSEFELIQGDHLKLPHGWQIGEEIPRN